MTRQRNSQTASGENKTYPVWCGSFVIGWSKCVERCLHCACLMHACRSPFWPMGRTESSNLMISDYKTVCCCVFYGVQSQAGEPGVCSPVNILSQGRGCELSSHPWALRRTLSHAVINGSLQRHFNSMGTEGKGQKDTKREMEIKSGWWKETRRSALRREVS